MALEPGQILDSKYRVGRLIGEGGMGTVYEGENSRIGRRVAIKVLHAQVASMPEFVERFEREARAAARIGSPHVCDVLDLGDLPNGDRYIVMEYLDGISFEDRLERGKMTAAQLAPIAFELLEGLGTMHFARVIHRDLKPANVFLARTPSGRGEIVKILDFGVAKLQPFEGEVGTMTQTGTLMGTPLYMSPEQARGARDVDGRTDIYAASVMFYRALTGVLPYTADTLNELLFKIVLEDPSPLRDHAPEVDEVFAEIVHKGLARDVGQRFQTAREYQEAIARWGKTQGRTSLAFSVTMASEPPGPASAPQDVPAMLAPRAMTRPTDGTPTAWSEDGPPGTSSRSRVAAVSPAAGAPASGRAIATATQSDSARLRAEAPVSNISVSASTVAMKSEPPRSGPWEEGPEAVPANAITSPRGEATNAGGAAGPRPGQDTAATSPSAPGPQRSRFLAIGLGAVGALALAMFFAFGRPPSPPSAGGAAAAPLPTPPAAALAPVATEMPGAAATPSTAPADGGTSQLEAAAASAASPSLHREPAAPAARKTVSRSEPRSTVVPPASTPIVAQAGTAPATAPPVASTASAKPAGSAARKFRTNLD